MKTIDVLCGKCNKWHFNIADTGWTAMPCRNCGNEIPYPKKRKKPPLRKHINRATKIASPP